MSDLLLWPAIYAAVLFACVLLPVAGMAALVPTLRTSRFRVRNYRGAEVTPGLGIVWVWWVAGFVMLMLCLVLAAGIAGIDLEHWDPAVTDILGTFSLAAVAIIPAFVFGMIDDVFDAGTDKGFRGHISALRSKRLTTGLLKLVGIGVASLLVGVGLTVGADDSYPVVGLIARTLVIALAANTINLLDLRPGRALKTYGIGSITIVMSVPFVWEAGGYGQGLAASGAIALGLLGPLIAAWRFDLREISMLGDAGANPAGVLLGVLVSALWPLTAVVGVAALLISVNLLAERVSFSAIIENNTILRSIDGFGRSNLGEPKEDLR